jgi:hypothetical protein
VDNRPMPNFWGCCMRQVVVLCGLLALGAAQADEAGLKRCRAVADSQARLACYDALPVAGSAAPSAPSAPSAAVAPAAPAAPPAAAPAPAAPPAPPAGFGLEHSAAAPQAVVSSIPGAFEGWEPRQRFRLANGQTWQVADDSQGVYSLRDPRVTIRRALLGGFVMEIEGAKRTLRVRRVE